MGRKEEYSLEEEPPPPKWFELDFKVIYPDLDDEEEELYTQIKYNFTPKINTD
ncbi:MAG: hypothetical protein QXD43_01460 [Candidatus Aenigmatarchaeota archaeon]